ncbi:hypothetical protein ADIS_0957 [Lunatimonas lonarensis]|uniref:Impact N-terminal domain-containing protein n=1 Tax=Lunatimonas lonarensis TaxID=1232681 RepID=R7ZX23_9BACT|nr:YigZ family protein [Lunatimonas lonarensis]EON78607.1 hypothetical protein ADIS_0957 [Lunatimonas lonarensis]
MEDAFITLSFISEGIYKDKGSRFLSFAYPVKTETDVKKHLDTIAKRYYDAAHRCYAYILGAPETTYRSYDDGEPNHSAGDPILGQIRSKGLTDSLVVVVRYFGGTKLGVGGLMNAYKTAASLALEANEVKKVLFKKSVRVQFDYADTAEVMRVISQYSMEISCQRFTDTCDWSLDCLAREAPTAAERLQLIPSVQLTWQTTDPDSLDPEA